MKTNKIVSIKQTGPVTRYGNDRGFRLPIQYNLANGSTHQTEILAPSKDVALQDLADRKAAASLGMLSLSDDGKEQVGGFSIQVDWEAVQSSVTIVASSNNSSIADTIK